MEHESQKKFLVENSPLRDAYALLNAHSPLELSNLYSEADQELMRNAAWDYENKELLVNKIKDILESVDPQTLTEEERDWRQEILWFWHHHAISCAIWRYKDKEAARFYAAKALEYQAVDHPNKITRLFDHLVNDRLDEAEEYLKEIDEEPEMSTAHSLVEQYKKGEFFT